MQTVIKAGDMPGHIGDMHGGSADMQHVTCGKVTHNNPLKSAPVTHSDVFPVLPVYACTDARTTGEPVNRSLCVTRNEIA